MLTCIPKFTHVICKTTEFPIGIQCVFCVFFFSFLLLKFVQRKLLSNCLLKYSVDLLYINWNQFSWLEPVYRIWIEFLIVLSELNMVAKPLVRQLLQMDMDKLLNKMQIDNIPTEQPVDASVKKSSLQHFIRIVLWNQWSISGKPYIERKLIQIRKWTKKRKNFWKMLSCANWSNIEFELNWDKSSSSKYAILSRLFILFFLLENQQTITRNFIEIAKGFATE